MYTTLARVAETSVTLVTLADAWAARLELDWDLITAANCCPSCSRLIRLATGVFGSKNAIQLAAMTDCAEAAGAEYAARAAGAARWPGPGSQRAAATAPEMPASVAARTMLDIAR